eukprot:jgi/Tetstr1/442654/TSEL_030748.t1
MGTGVKNASVDGPCHAWTRWGLKSTMMKARDKAVLSAVFDECWPHDTQTEIPYPLKETSRFPIAAPLYIDRICYATFNYRAGYPAANYRLHGFVGLLKQQQNPAGGIIKHNTNAVKNLAATQAFSGDNVDEGSSPEPPAKRAKQPAKPVAGVPSRGRGGTRGRADGGPFGSRAGRQTAMAVALAATRKIEIDYNC